MASAWLTGYILSARVSRRVYELERCVSLLGAFKHQLEYTLSTIERIGYELNMREEYLKIDILPAFLEAVEQGTPVPNAWRQASNGTQMLLTKDERTLLADLADIIGAAELHGQLNGIEYCKLVLEDHLKLARTEKENRTKLYQTLGMLAGAVIAVVLI